MNEGYPIRAFPVQFIDDEEQYQNGMTLRDYFAAKALEGMLANPNLNPDWGYLQCAEQAWFYAGAMLETRDAPYTQR